MNPNCIGTEMNEWGKGKPMTLGANANIIYFDFRAAGIPQFSGGGS